MFVLNTNGFFGGFDVELPDDPAEADHEDLIQAFTRGHCHSLALGLHELTGWPIIGANWEELNEDDWDLSSMADGYPDEIPDHIGVMPPHGDPLDITALSGGGEWDSWRYDEPLDADALRGGYWGAYRMPDLEAGRVYARFLLDELGIEV